VSPDENGRDRKKRKKKTLSKTEKKDPETSDINNISSPTGLLAFFFLPVRKARTKKAVNTPKNTRPKVYSDLTPV
jgi:hypothetical protein